MSIPQIQTISYCRKASVLTACDTTETKACPRYDSGGKDVKYVLEVTAGFVDEFNITEDSKIEL